MYKINRVSCYILHRRPPHPISVPSPSHAGHQGSGPPPVPHGIFHQCGEVSLRAPPDSGLFGHSAGHAFHDGAPLRRQDKGCPLSRLQRRLLPQSLGGDFPETTGSDGISQFSSTPRATLRTTAAAVVRPSPFGSGTRPPQNAFSPVTPPPVPSPLDLWLVS